MSRRPPKNPSAYERRSLAKRAIGARLREARELKGLTVTAAAEALGYSQPKDISYWETGQRMPPVQQLVRLAVLYESTADFMLGLTPDPEIDPGAALTRLLAARTAAEVDRLIETIMDTGLAELRAARPDTARVLRMAQTILEADRALRRCREVAGEAFDTLPAGAPVVARVELAAELAAGLLHDLRLSGRLSLPAGTKHEGADRGH